MQLAECNDENLRAIGRRLHDGAAALRQAVDFVVGTYGAEAPLAPLELQYADFAAWQQRTFTDDILAPHIEYWRSQLAGSETLELPVDRPRVLNYKVSTILGYQRLKSFELSAPDRFDVTVPACIPHFG